MFSPSIFFYLSLNEYCLALSLRGGPADRLRFPYPVNIPQNPSAELRLYHSVSAAVFLNILELTNHRLLDSQHSAVYWLFVRDFDYSINRLNDENVCLHFRVYIIVCLHYCFTCYL